MADLLVGSTIAGCRVQAVAGRGGMGVVYRATQLALDRTVALKVIAPRLAADQAFRDRFQSESQLAASIEHPNVIPVYEAGELDGTLYLIMRWVDGTDLRALLSTEGRLEPARAVRLLRPVAAALAAAHRRGLVHRDIKPANVLIAAEDEHVYLTDFGIARRVDADGMTRTGVIVGTIDYTAPERIEGGRGSPASDIYSFGCMLYETLTGKIPYERENELAKMFAHLSEPVPSLPGGPPSLNDALARTMAKRPEDRFASATQLVTALDEVLRELDTVSTELDRATAAPTERLAPTAEADKRPAHAAPAEPATRPAHAGPSEPATRLAHAAPAEPATRLPQAPPAERQTRLAKAAPAERETVPPAPRRRRPAVLWSAVAAGILIVAGVVVAILAGGGGGENHRASTTGPRATVGTPSVLQGSGIVVQSPTKLSGAPTALAADASHAWVAAAGRLVPLGSASATNPVTVSGTPSAIAVDGNGRLWMTGVGPTGASVLDPASGRQSPVDLGQTGQSPDLIALSGSAAWLAHGGAGTITRVPLAGGTAQPITVRGPVAAMAEAFSRLWVASSTGAVTVVNDDGTITSPSGPTLSSGAVGVAPSNGVWFLGSTLTRVDPRANLATGGVYATHPDQAPVGPDPAGIGALAGDASIWVLTKGKRMLTRIATNGAHNNTVIAKVSFPVSPGAVAVGDHVLWVTVPSTHQVYAIRF